MQSILCSVHCLTHLLDSENKDKSDAPSDDCSNGDQLAYEAVADGEPSLSQVILMSTNQQCNEQRQRQEDMEMEREERYIQYAEQ